MLSISPVEKTFAHFYNRIANLNNKNLEKKNVEWTGCPICLNYFEATKKKFFKEKNHELAKGSTQNYRHFFKKLLKILQKIPALGKSSRFHI